MYACKTVFVLKFCSDTGEFDLFLYLEPGFGKTAKP